ncbi:putative NAD-dependent protein deacetylase sirtuin-7-like [Apostichopus japonicus]|uniref:protein acetyllysine N-acetyltransferase n=1 Tax=Stichopus japonicus TaxID=307972 RepID=A0A2G8KTA8_STIJA|nr:putative NAD-dependent protein deacetylase sirtuin-7-like [Apostichopus japonicus]
MEEPSETRKRPSRNCISLVRKLGHTVSLKHEKKEKEKKIKQILKKPECQRTEEDVKILKELDNIVQELHKRARQRDRQKAHLEETEDVPEVLESKVKLLADLLKDSDHAILYTGAGVSTAASIPDYRGPNGVWTLLQKGKEVKPTSIVDACPTTAHMGIFKLYQEGLVKHVVSQNCDGLHLRSGLPQESLSEIHGNMFIEVCKNCTRERQYIRTFDVTEKTSFHRHRTSRKCHRCRSNLEDTIVHFGEKSSVKYPLNWEGAVENVEAAGLIVCLGSSLKVLRKYTCLWRTHQPLQRRPKLCIVNLQWTPKDSQAYLKINGRCDDVVQRLCCELCLEIPEYKQSCDPLFSLTTRLRKREMSSFSTKELRLVPSPCETPLKSSVDSELELKKEEQDGEAEIDKDHENPPQPGWFGKGLRKRKLSQSRRRSSKS